MRTFGTHSGNSFETGPPAVLTTLTGRTLHLSSYLSSGEEVVLFDLRHPLTSPHTHPLATTNLLSFAVSLVFTDSTTYKWII